MYNRNKSKIYMKKINISARKIMLRNRRMMNCKEKSI